MGGGKGALGFHNAWRLGGWGAGLGSIRNRRSTYLSRSSQPGGSMSSFGAMALGNEECQGGLRKTRRDGAASRNRIHALRFVSFFGWKEVWNGVGELRGRSQVTEQKECQTCVRVE